MKDENAIESERLIKSKADAYDIYRQRCIALESVLRKLLYAHKQSSVNWEAFRDAEILLGE